MPTDPGAGLIFAAVFLGSVMGLLFLLAWLEGGGRTVHAAPGMRPRVRLALLLARGRRAAATKGGRSGMLRDDCDRSP